MSLQDKLEKLVALSKADGCVVLGSESSSVNVRWANNTSTTNGLSRSAYVTAISIVGQTVGVRGTSDLSDDGLESLIRSSEQACDGKPPALDYMPLPIDTGSSGGWDDTAPTVDPNVFSDLVRDLADCFRRAEADDRLLFGYSSQTSTTTYVATSTGIRRRHEHSIADLELTAKSPDFTRSAWFGNYGSRVADAEVVPMYERLCRRLDLSERTIELPPGRYPVILEPAATAELLAYMASTMTARAAAEGRSAFSKPGGDRVGEKMFPEFINLYSDPSEPGMDAAPFVATAWSEDSSSVFDNGLPLGRTDWVSEGVLKDLVAPRFWAEKLGKPARPGMPNIILTGNESRSADDLIASTDRALLVTKFWYTRMLDPQTLLLTGLTRDGVFLVEEGEIKGAVNNFRYNMSPLAVLAQASELGASQLLGNYKMPHLRTEDFFMSSVSQAT